MTPLIDFLNRISNWKSLVLLLAIYISFPAYWLKNAETSIRQLASKPVGPIDLTIGFNPGRTLEMVADYGPAVRPFYIRTELTLDVVYPLVYALLFAVILTLLFRNQPYKPFSWVTLLPFLTQGLDYLENATIVGLLSTYPSQNLFLAVLCELFKLAKWLSLGVIMILIVYGLYHRLLGKKAQRP